MDTPDAPMPGQRDEETADKERGRFYSVYVILVLLLADLLNFADRSILSALAEPIKQDLGLRDAQIGFLYGTSFIVLNTILAIPLGRVADTWLRHRLLALGLFVWSALTTLSAGANNFTQLATARLGVGVGEATFAPTSHSLVSDIFAPANRAKAFAVLYSAPYVGTAMALYGAGWIVVNWPRHCGTFDLCQVAGWQVAFLAFGTPGIVLAFFALWIGDPAQGEAAVARRNARPLQEGGSELTFLVPPMATVMLYRLGGIAAARTNLLLGTGLALLSVVLSATTGDWSQWLMAAVAYYALGSWCQSLKYRDAPFHERTLRSPAFYGAVLAGSFMGIYKGSVSFWSISHAIRTFGITAAEAGAWIGASLAIGSIIGAMGGGILVDRLRPRRMDAVLWVAGVSIIVSGISLLAIVTSSSLPMYCVAFGVFMAAGMTWVPGLAAFVQELILPSMRGRAAALFVTTMTLVGMTIGPYLSGKLADLSGSLGFGLGLTFVASAILSFAMLALAIRACSQMARVLSDERGRQG